MFNSICLFLSFLTFNLVNIQVCFFSQHTLHHLGIDCYFKRFAAIRGGSACPVSASMQSGETSSLRTNYRRLLATNANKLWLNPNGNNNNDNHINDGLCPLLQEPAGPGHFLKVGPMWVVRHHCHTTQHATRLLLDSFILRSQFFFVELFADHHSSRASAAVSKSSVCNLSEGATSACREQQKAP